VKTFSEVSNHSSYRALPSKVQELLRMAFNDPQHDLLAALSVVNPKAKMMSRDIQLDAIRKVMMMPSMLTLLAWICFGIELSELEDVPPLPGGQRGLI
jgi:hypothetical protein